MKISSRPIIVFLILFINIYSYSQIAIGQWRDHFSYRQAFHLAETSDKIFCSGQKGLFAITKEGKEKERLSKVTGLSDVGITAIKGDNINDIVVIGYENANIDVITNDKIINVSDIKNKLITGEKKINDIEIYNGSAYLSCSFGIVVLDLTKYEIKDTYYIGLNGNHTEVYQVTTDSTYLYAATEQGIFKADLSSTNLSDFENWKRFDFIPNYTKKFNSVVYFNKSLIAVYDDNNYNADTVYKITGTNYTILDSSLKQVSKASFSNNRLFVFSSYFLREFVDTTSYPLYGYYNNESYPLDAIYENNRTWIADYKNGLIVFEAYYKTIKMNGPYSDKIASLDALNGVVWGAGGGTDVSLTNLWNKAMIYSFQNQEWLNFTDKDYSELLNKFDFVDIAIDPTDETHVFASSWGNGIIEFKNNAIINLYNDSNSTLQNAQTSGPYVRVGGIKVDKNKNLWAVNTGVNNAISVKEPDGTWTSFSYGSYISFAEMGKFIITQDNTKWILLLRGKGMFAFNENNTIDDVSDDKYIKFNITDEYGKIITNEVYSIAEDLDGIIWIGTNKGIVLYQNPANVFSGDNFYAQQILIPRNDGSDLADILLETETITAIAVDGANRKWIGTLNSGVYLISPDGQEQICHFDVDNSPLISNYITSIAIDGSTGEVFFGTANGIISYKSTATDGAEQFKKVYAYPNPVKPGYEGVITIKGLVTNSNVKITDVSGNLVYETTAFGGQAIWYGKDLSGNKVNSGVYLAFCTNEDGSETFVTKILFIK